MVANALRAMLSEIGIVAAQGIKGLGELMQRLAQPSAEVPELMRGALLLLVRQWQALDAAERALERQIKQMAAADQEARRLMQVPGVGPIIASALLPRFPMRACSAAARGFAAWIGLTGRDRGTGGKPRPGPISKQGDRMLRALLINGASAYLRQARRRGVSDPWLRELLARRPYKVVLVALAAKTARIIWAMLVTGERYRDRASVSAASLGQRPTRSHSAVGKGKSGVMANGQEPRSRHSEPSSRVKARRNDWNSIRVLHQGQRSATASKGRIHDRSRTRSAEAPKSPCRQGAVHT